MIDLKVDKRRFKNHMEYAKWLYIGLIAGACLLFGMAYSMTEPKVPDEYRVDILIDGNVLYPEGADRWNQEMLARLTPDQQVVDVFGMPLTTYGYQAMELIAAKMSVAEYEVYILPYDMYYVFASQEAFYDLTDIADTFSYELPDDRTLDDYYVAAEAKEGVVLQPRLYGLPADGAKGMLLELGIDPAGKVISVFTANKNLENAIECTKFILEQKGGQ